MKHRIILNLLIVQIRTYVKQESASIIQTVVESRSKVWESTALSDVRVDESLMIEIFDFVWVG